MRLQSSQSAELVEHGDSADTDASRDSADSADLTVHITITKVL